MTRPPRDWGECNTAPSGCQIRCQESKKRSLQRGLAGGISWRHHGADEPFEPSPPASGAIRKPWRDSPGRSETGEERNDESDDGKKPACPRFPISEVWKDAK